jgi:hypothetical protein
VINIDVLITRLVKTSELSPRLLQYGRYNLPDYQKGFDYRAGKTPVD